LFSLRADPCQYLRQIRRHGRICSIQFAGRLRDLPSEPEYQDMGASFRAAGFQAYLPVNTPIAETAVDRDKILPLAEQASSQRKSSAHSGLLQFGPRQNPTLSRTSVL
jgi:hypothetical protein